MEHDFSQHKENIGENNLPEFPRLISGRIRILNQSAWLRWSKSLCNSTSNQLFFLHYYWNFQLTKLILLIPALISHIHGTETCISGHIKKKPIFPLQHRIENKRLTIKMSFWYFCFRSDTVADGSAPRMLYQSFFGICSNAIIPSTRSGPFQISGIEILTTIHYSLCISGK